MKFLGVSLILLSQAVATSLSAPQLPANWAAFQPILEMRVKQNSPKMKLSKEHADSFVQFLTQLTSPTPALINLERILPKVTLELLMAVHARGLALSEAEKMATYLQSLVETVQFQNLSAFDENTSHIIGREWHEIDYSNENMTWQQQKQQYLPYGINHFKSSQCLIKFFQYESKLPYFKKIYRPQNP